MTNYCHYICDHPTISCNSFITKKEKFINSFKKIIFNQSLKHLLSKIDPKLGHHKLQLRGRHISISILPKLFKIVQKRKLWSIPPCQKLWKSVWYPAWSSSPSLSCPSGGRTLQSQLIQNHLCRRCQSTHQSVVKIINFVPKPYTSLNWFMCATLNKLNIKILMGPFIILIACN